MTSSVYDPLGLVSPVIVPAKKLLQEAGTKVGPDQLGPPVRVGSTRIVSEHEKNIK